MSKNDNNVDKIILIPLIISISIAIFGVAVDNSIPFFVALLVFFVFLLLLFKRRFQVFQIIYKFRFKYFGGIKLNVVAGFYGREELIKNILLWHREHKNNECAFLCGFGGSGKSTIAKFFSNSCNQVVNTIIFADGNLPSAESIPRDAIIFFDYIIERGEEIAKIINALNRKPDTHVSILCVERDSARNYLKEYCKIHFSKEFDLNSQYKISMDDLKNILKFRISHNMENGKYIFSNLTYSENFIFNAVEKINQTIDPKFGRPIFATIIADLFRENQNLNLQDVETKNQVMSKFWENMISLKKQSALIDQLSSYNNYLQNQVALSKFQLDSKMMWLFSTLTSLVIKIEFFQGSCFFSFSNNNYEVELPEVKKYFEKKYNYLTVNIFRNFYFIQEKYLNHSCIEKEKGYFYVEPLEYDIFSSWLLSSVLKDSEDELSSTIGLIPPNYLFNAFSFLMRAIDEEDESLIYWFEIIQLISAESINMEMLYSYVYFCLKKINADSQNVQDIAKKLLHKLIKEVSANIIMLEEIKKVVLQENLSGRDKNEIIQYIETFISEITNKHVAIKS